MDLFQLPPHFDKRRNARSSGLEGINPDNPLDTGREFLKDTIRRKIDFSQTDQNQGVPPPPLEKPYPPEAARIKLLPVGQWQGVESIDLASAIEATDGSAGAGGRQEGVCDLSRPGGEDAIRLIAGRRFLGGCGRARPERLTFQDPERRGLRPFGPDVWCFFKNRRFCREGGVSSAKIGWSAENEIVP
jgi:hypothetical protein